MILSSLSVPAIAEDSRFCGASSAIIQMSNMFASAPEDSIAAREQLISTIKALVDGAIESESVSDLSNLLAYTSALTHQWRGISGSWPYGTEPRGRFYQALNAGYRDLWKLELRCVWLGVQGTLPAFEVSVQQYLRRAAELTSADWSLSNNNSHISTSGSIPYLDERIQSLPLTVFKRNSRIRIANRYLRDWLGETGWFTEVELSEDSNIIARVETCEEGWDEIVLLDTISNPDQLNEEKTRQLVLYTERPDIVYLNALCN